MKLWSVNSLLAALLVSTCGVAARAASSDTASAVPRPWGAYYVSKDGKWDPVDSKSVKNSDQDDKWAQVSYPQYDGKKIRIAFVHTEQGGGAKIIAGADMTLMKALRDTGRFTVLGDPKATPPPAFLISVSMEDAGSKNSYHGAFGLGVKSHRQTIALTYTISDPKTSEVLLVENIKGSATSGGIAVAYGGAYTEGDSDPVTQAAISTCVNKVAYLIAMRHVE